MLLERCTEERRMQNLRPWTWPSRWCPPERLPTRGSTPTRAPTSGRSATRVKPLQNVFLSHLETFKFDLYTLKSRNGASLHIVVVVVFANVYTTMLSVLAPRWNSVTLACGDRPRSFPPWTVDCLLPTYDLTPTVQQLSPILNHRCISPPFCHVGKQRGGGRGVRRWSADAATRRQIVMEQ